MGNLQVLCFDGGGIRGYSSLLILAAIMRSIFYDDPTKGALGDIHPYKYFDVISGAGTGGVAFLLGRLKLTIPECLLAYRKLSSQILRDGPGLPLYSIDKLLKVSQSILEEHLEMNTGQDLKEAEVGIMLDQGWPLPAPIEEGSPMIFGFGVSENMPYCFRGHRPHSESDNKLDAHITNFDETFAAMMAAKGLFDAHQVPDGQGRRSFLDRPFPYGLLNPAVHVLDELAKEDNRSVDMIISIGGGEVADKDIPDLLHLAGFGDPVGVTLPLVLPKAVTDTCSYAISRFRYRDPDKAIHEFRSAEREYEKNIQRETSERLVTRLEGYKRFSIGPVANVGPNDYLSVGEVSKASKNYIEDKKEAIQAVGRQIRARKHIQVSYHS